MPPISSVFTTTHPLLIVSGDTGAGWSDVRGGVDLTDHDPCRGGVEGKTDGERRLSV